MKSAILPAIGGDQGAAERREDELAEGTRGGGDAEGPGALFRRHDAAQGCHDDAEGRHGDADADQDSGAEVEHDGASATAITTVPMA